MDEAGKRQWDVWLGIVAPILTVAGILVGVWQFNRGENNRVKLENELVIKKDTVEFQRKLWLNRLETYKAFPHNDYARGCHLPLVWRLILPSSRRVAAIVLPVCLSRRFSLCGTTLGRRRVGDGNADHRRYSQCLSGSVHASWSYETRVAKGSGAPGSAAARASAPSARASHLRRCSARAGASGMAIRGTSPRYWCCRRCRNRPRRRSPCRWTSAFRLRGGSFSCARAGTQARSSLFRSRAELARFRAILFHGTRPLSG
jgi:hypothetical protein